MLRIPVGDKTKQWDFALAQAEFAYNIMINHSTSLILFIIVYTKARNHTTYLAVLPSSTNNGALAFIEQVVSTQLRVTQAL